MAVAPGSAPIDLEVGSSIGIIGEVTGTLPWNGEGGYSFDGTASAWCGEGNHTSKMKYTAWLEYSGAGQSWKKTKEEAVCTKSATEGTHPIHVSGTLRKGQKLDLRVSTWTSES
ncbi:hypothetical protein [Streptomyces sp. x-80]|uniref:hypothetical protein n=1 Tax=Streptomyces sp. x-80 TaxID=2789282 RepID=UPI003981081B